MRESLRLDPPVSKSLIRPALYSKDDVDPYLLIDSKEGHGPRAVNGNNRKENKGAPKWGSKPRGLTEINSRKDPVTVASAEIEALLNPD